MVKWKDLRCGDVFVWRDFPYQHDEKIKDRWFVFLGRMDITNNPVFYYMQTTTTNIDVFEKGGPRQSHKTIKMTAAETPFREDCVLDATIATVNLTEEQLDKFSPCFKYKGHLPENKKMEILKKIDTTYSKIKCRDIRNSFHRDGMKI